MKITWKRRVAFQVKHLYTTRPRLFLLQ